MSRGLGIITGPPEALALHAPSCSPLEGWSLILVDALPVGVSVETEVDLNLGYDG
jgi:hypothetical protein